MSNRVPRESYEIIPSEFDRRRLRGGLAVLSHGIFMVRFVSMEKLETVVIRGPVAHFPGISPRPTEGAAYVIMQGGGHPRAPFKEPGRDGSSRVRRGTVPSTDRCSRLRDSPRNVAAILFDFPLCLSVALRFICLATKRSPRLSSIELCT